MSLTKSNNAVLELLFLIENFKIKVTENESEE
jgi:hypothetical protein